ncbi:MAG: diguanylate cyclase response regulator [Burkholderiales bacterium RIFCSPLOWO2_12_FULL_64_99]|uniref:diguanylate cyclase n=1 Tax=Aquabacterium sp. TaxID=1872578 RepID=UPI0008BAB5F1|nr:diguanylate cyclase [Aquabacterium sp.]OGB03361.1 MAG: diguanylate cyclase response regulator [Burkholderiales bacterium RIFCSPHIGHO2_12_FULL_63_20]OGB67170.1 MAG: diguanylate cyclase response regulator [Burkholderiales bacterium RIFCSPLOWO2_12_FULL_64_99]
MLPVDATLADLLKEPERKPRLLVVDDQPTNIQVLYRVFADDCQVFMATSGEQALHTAREEAPDVILLDVMMPDMDGYEVCRQLKQDSATRDIPILFVTAHHEAQEEARGLACGAVDFITKPIHPAVVRARVHTHLTLKRQTDVLKRLVFIDALTHVFNRRYFDERLTDEWGRAQRTGKPLCLILIDVDFFKQFNDMNGHQRGDDALRQVAHALKAATLRPGDVVCRYGGEEFACLLPNTDLDGALQVAQRMKLAVRELAIAHTASGVAEVLTISAGLAVRPPASDRDAAALVALADAQLYRAKAEGRARVCHAVLD